MNRNRYRLVFNATLGMQVPAAETARGRGKTASGSARALAGMVLAGVVLATPAWADMAANALPENPVVKHGSIGFAQSGNTLNINQASQAGIIHWNKFNIGSGATVNFNQPNVTSATLNRITGSEVSVIQGAMNATGAVYVINRNGIVFDKGAQVNLHTLVASTLDIKDDALFLSGYRGAANQTAAFSADYNSTGELDLGSALGLVEVAEGAYITSRQGGRIILMGADATNRGTIETNGGQILLAAGRKAYIHTPEKGESDSLLNGIVVAVESGGTARNLGTLSAGPGGDVTLIGAIVKQEGTATATTTVNVNGTIHLKAQYIDPAATDAILNNRPAANATGEVVFGENSRTAVMPALDEDKVEAGIAAGKITQAQVDAYYRGESDLSGLFGFVSDDVIQDGQTFTRSVIFAQGKTVWVQGGASLVAPSGEITLFARGGSENPNAYLIDKESSQSFLLQSNNAEGLCLVCRVQVDDGARIDVSGVDAVPIAMERNVVEVELRGSELADSPLLHGSENAFYEAMYGDATNPLYGKKIKVDIRDSATVDVNGETVTRKGTALADASGYIAQVGRKIDEKSTAGGTVNLYSEGGVVVKEGATIDFSGGSIEYQGGDITTSQLLYKGRLYDVATATADRLYSGLGADKTIHEEGYVEGKDAGSLRIVAPVAALQGTVKGNTVAGRYQRGGTGDALPKAGELILGFAQTVDAGTNQDYRLMSKVSFGEPGHDAPDFDASLWVALSDEQKAALGRDIDLNPAMREIVLDPEALKKNGIGHLSIYTNNAIELATGQKLDMGVGGSVTLTGAQIDIDGNIDAPGGAVSLTSQNGVYNTASALVGMDALTLNQHIAIDGAIRTAGQWTNDYLDRRIKAGYQAVALDGGTISVSANDLGDLSLGEGSLLDASAGAWLKIDGKTMKGGKGGNISLMGKALSLAGALQSYGVLESASKVGKGGTLTMQTNPDVQIGGEQTAVASELRLGENFFTHGGFSGYSVRSTQGDLTVADNASVAPRAYTRVVSSGRLVRQSGSNLAGFSQAEWLDKDQEIQAVRSAADLSLAAAYNLTVGKGASIDLDALAALTLSAGNIDIEGDLSAPGGSIMLKAGASGGEYAPNVSVWLGSDASLSVAGIARTYRAGNGLLQGEVLDGGSISVLTGGYLVAETGAVIDASGTVGNLDLPDDASGGVKYVRTALPSAGGTIRLAASEGLFLQGGAVLKANGGADEAEAGTLRIELDRAVLSDELTIATYPTDPGTGELYPHRLFISSDSGGATPDYLTAPGASLQDADDASGVVSASHLGNFDTIELKAGDRIVFKDSMSIAPRGSLTIDTPNIELADAAEGVTLKALYVNLGNGDPIKQSKVEAATTGEGVLNVTADLIDLTGAFALQGVKQTNLTSTGDVRLVGVVDVDNDDTLTPEGKLSTAGDMTIKGAQTYAATLSEYVLESIKPAGEISFAGWHHPNGDLYIPYAPQAAGGSIAVTADNITQAGVLRAPVGSISLDAGSTLTLESGSLTSVSTDGLAISFGRVVNGATWVYDFHKSDGTAVSRTIYSGSDEIVDIPTKRIVLSGDVVNVQEAATVDMSGGGDLVGNEFASGAGGSSNYLAAEGVFAIVPAGAYSVAFAAADYQANQYRYTSTSNSLARTGVSQSVQAGESVYLAAIPELGIEAGYYAILPAQYAMLPGAYAVRAVAGTTDMTASQNISRLDGSYLVAGYKTSLGSTNTGAHRWSGFEVASRAVVATNADFSFNIGSETLDSQTLSGRSEITDYRMGALVPTINRTYELAVPRLVADAGRLSVSAGRLALDGTLDFSKPDSGLGGELDIASSKIAITDGSAPSVADADDYLVLNVDKLASYDVDSLMIGGTREAVDGDASILKVNQVAEAVLVETSADKPLSAPEVMLVSRGAITLAEGSEVRGEGEGDLSNETLVFGDNDAGVSGDGVLVRASSGALRGVVRKNVSRTGAVTAGLYTAANALVSGEKSVNLDATYTAFNLGKVELGEHGALQLGATRIALGEVTDILEGVFVTNELLDSLGNPEKIVLKSYSNFDVYGDAVLGSTDTANLTLQGAGFAGKETGTLKIEADTVSFANADGTALDTGGAAGTGALEVDADYIYFGDGVVETAGFDTVTLTARGEIGGFEDGEGGLRVSNDLNMTAQRIVGYDGSDTTFTAGGKLTTATYVATDGEALPELGKAPLGARMSFIGDQGIDHGGNIEMPAGWLTMTAESGDLNLVTDSKIFTGGVVRQFHGVDDYVNVYVAGGLTELEAGAGDVNIATGAMVDVSGRDLLTSGQSSDPEYDGRGSADAGTLSIYASGNFNLEGELRGDVVQPDSGSGSLSDDELSRRPTGAALVVDASTMTGGLTNLLDRSSGFAEEFSLRLRNADLVLQASKTIASERVNLSADAGLVDIAGTIDAKASGGGWVMAAAGKELYLRDGARIDASATGEEERGGEVWLISGMDKAYADADDYAGALVLENGSKIDVNGTLTDDSRTTESVGGRVHLQAPRLASGQDARITQSYGVYDDNDEKGAVGTMISGASLIEAIGNQVFEYGTVGTTQMNAIKTDIAAYTSTSGMSESRLGGSVLGGDSVFHARAGVEVRSSGDLKFSNDYDLGAITAVSGGEPGVLTLRAAGNLLIEGSLSDGFNSATGTTLDSGDSWSYRLVAGSDLSAADPMAVKRNVEAATGDFVLKGGKLIRTGTGSIQMAAAGDSEIGLVYSGAYSDSSQSNGSYNAASVVYSAGKAEAADSRASKPSDSLYKAYNTVDGGSISITAGDDIHAPEVVQLMNQWLVRRGYETNDTLTTGLSWGIDFRYFNQGVGALGGGDVRVRAGGDIENLSVSLPTTGRDYATADIGTDIVETGGGDLSVVAGSDIRSAVFYVQQGEGRVVSGEVIGAMSEDDDKNLLLALGDAAIQVNARAGLTLESAFNPTVAPMGSKVSSILGTKKSSSYFSTYGEDSGVDMVSAQGDVVLNNKMTYDDLGSDVLDGVTLVYGSGDDASSNMYLIYPGSLKAVAANGDLKVSRSLWMHPSAKGQLYLLAAGNVEFGADGEPAIVSMSDQSVSVLSTVTNPGITYVVAPDSGFVEQHASVPVHAGDTDPVRIYAERGDIVGNDGSGLTLPKSFEFLAGRDIIDVGVVAQNLGDDQTSVFRAGRDIRYAAPRISGRLVSSGNVSIGGAGYLEVVAGRDIDLGTSAGIVATGNLDNANLDYGGADIVLLAGMGTEVDADGNTRVRLPDYEAFLAKYNTGAAKVDYYASLLDYERLRQALLDPDNAALSYAEVLAKLEDANYRAEMATAAAAEYEKAKDTFDALLNSGVASERGKAARLLYYNELQQAADEASLMKQLAALGFDLNNLNTVDESGVAGRFLETLASAGISVSSLENFARFFDRAAALSEANSSVAGYDVLADLGYAGRADKAIAALLPAGGYAGNFNGFYSQVRTEQASNIDMLTPGGNAVVGLVNAEKVDLSTDGNGQDIWRADSTFGVYTVNGGSISSYSQGDFLVNTSRVFTLGWEATLDRSGGEYLLRDDIFLYSADGDVDAGKGAKTVSSTPPPTITTDDKGYTKSDIGSSISGSGIGVLLARAVINRGDTYLIAPNGEVNAGDAGVRASGNLFIDANRVVGADNIVAVGVSIGVPTAVDTSGLSVSGIGNIGDAGKAAGDVTDSIAKNSEDAEKLAQDMKNSLVGFNPSFITVDVLGFGAEATEEEDEEKRRRAKKS